VFTDGQLKLYNASPRTRHWQSCKRNLHVDRYKTTSHTNTCNWM